MARFESRLWSDGKLSRHERHALKKATRSLFERRDVIIVASVSCIYGLGSPENYHDLCVSLKKGEAFDRQELLRRLDVLAEIPNAHTNMRP